MVFAIPPSWPVLPFTCFILKEACLGLLFLQRKSVKVLTDFFFLTMVISEIREWVWWTTVECWGAGTRKPQNLPASRRERGRLRWARAAAAQILGGLSSFTCTFFVVHIHGEKETNLMRISGDIATGSFACGGCRGSGPWLKPSAEDKLSWEESRKELQQMKAKRLFQSRFATSIFPDETEFAVQSWPVLPFLSADWQSSPGGSPGSPAPLSAKI